MKGIIFPAQGQACLQDEPAPVCGAEQVLCRTLYSGLSNGTERHFLVGGPYGGRKWPCRIGYQNVGEVIEVGSQVRTYQVGDRFFTANFAQHVECFAQNASNPQRDDHLMLRLPDAIESTHAALFGVASVAMHDVRLAGTAQGERAAVIGAGLIGQFVAQCARAAGADVTLCSRQAHRLAVAAKLGLNTFDMSPDTAWDDLLAVGPFDVVFETSGADVLDRIIGVGFAGPSLLRKRGRLMLVAGRDTVTYSSGAAQKGKLSIVQASHFERPDLLRVAELAEAGTIQIAPLIQSVVPIAQAIEVYERLRDDPMSVGGTVFDWQ